MHARSCVVCGSLTDPNGAAIAPPTADEEVKRRTAQANERAATMAVTCHQQAKTIVDLERQVERLTRQLGVAVSARGLVALPSLGAKTSNEWGGHDQPLVAEEEDPETLPKYTPEDADRIAGRVCRGSNDEEAIGPQIGPQVPPCDTCFGRGTLVQPSGLMVNCHRCDGTGKDVF